MTMAIVTGGIRGIGLAISQGLLARGVSVVAITRSASDGPNLAGMSVVEVDLSDPHSANFVAERFGEADILINNAGHMNGISLDEYDERKRAHILNLNLVTPVELMWRLGRSMAKRGQGRVVNNTSIAAHIGHPDFWYGATKAGLLNATKSMARALGSQGVIANAFAAGPTATDMLAVIPEERKAAMKSASILGRFAEPREVAETAIWLAMDSPAYINGICIDINNGSFLR